MTLFTSDKHKVKEARSVRKETIQKKNVSHGERKSSSKTVLLKLFFLASLTLTFETKMFFLRGLKGRQVRLAILLIYLH